MAKVDVPYDRYLGQLLKALGDPGALLVSVDDKGRPNAMTIGWAQVGIIWGRKILSVMVRPSRYTYRCLEATHDFTVNVPYANQVEAVACCGSKSGKNMDKFAECGFTPLPADDLKSPGINESGLIYQCQVVNTADFVPERLMPQICTDCYSSGDYHRVYFGQILRVLADKDFEERFRR